MLKQIIEIIIGLTGLFSLDQIVSASGWTRAEVKHRLDRLESEGLIRRVQENRGRNIKRPGGPVPKEILYVKCAGLPARLKRMTASQKSNTDRDKIYWTLRVMRRATVPDLVQLTGAGEDNTRDYIGLLHSNGYVRPVNPIVKPVTWCLVKDPGPARPRISEKKEEG